MKGVNISFILGLIVITYLDIMYVSLLMMQVFDCWKCIFFSLIRISRLWCHIIFCGLIILWITTNTPTQQSQPINTRYICSAFNSTADLKETCPAQHVVLHYKQPESSSPLLERLHGCGSSSSSSSRDEGPSGEFIPPSNHPSIQHYWGGGAAFTNSLWGKSMGFSSKY